METGRVFAGESIHITSDAFDRLRDFPGRSLFRAFEEHVFDKMAHTIDLRRLVSGADADPQTEADAGHVRHFRGGDREAVLEMSDLIHLVLSERFRHDFGRADAPLVLEDHINGLLRIIGNGEQVQVAGANEGIVVLHLVFHPSN